MSKRRVVITGMGILSPLGTALDENWKNIVAGKNGIATISQFDATGYPCTIAGEVKNFEPARYMTDKEARKMDRFIQLGMAAGIDAVKDSGIEVNESNAERIGVYIGSGIGGLNTIEAGTRTLMEKGHRRISPFYIPMSIINMISGNLSIMFGMQGPNLSMVTACATATHAIGEAARLIETQIAKRPVERRQSTSQPKHAHSESPPASRIESAIA